MKFALSWQIDQDKWIPVLELWSGLTPAERADAGPGVKILGRWHDMASRRGFAIMEADDVSAVQAYAMRWNPHMDLEVFPVVDDEESAAVAKTVVSAQHA